MHVQITDPTRMDNGNREVILQDLVFSAKRFCFIYKRSK